MEDFDIEYACSHLRLRLP